MSHRQTSAELADTIVDTYFSFIRALLAVFRVLANICSIIGGLLCFGFALYIEADLAQQAPIWNIVAFLITWFGIALECEALAQLEARGARTDHSMASGPGAAVASPKSGAASMSAMDGSCELCPECCYLERLNDNATSADWLEGLLRNASLHPMPRTPD
ncbi:hypothetical protein [Bradyrhizobium sp. USDA 4451]